MSSDQDWVPLWTVADEVRNVVDPAALGSSVVHYSVPSVELTGSGTMESSSDIRSAKQRLHGHEVLISKLNPRKSRVVLVEPHELPIVGSTEFVAIRAKRIDCRFLAYFLSSEVVRTQLE